MNLLPNDWLALLAVVYALRLKHGMDPDHLATIDGIARGNAARDPRLARWSECLFSAGHGAIVILVAIGVSLVARQWETPAWLDALGASICRCRRNRGSSRIKRAASRCCAIPQ